MHNHDELKKYYDMLITGNAIAARLNKKIISEHSAKVLFKEMIETLAQRIEEDKTL